MEKRRRGAAPRDHPGVKVRAVTAKSLTPQPTPTSQSGKVQAAVVNNAGETIRSWMGLMDSGSWDSLECRGYTSLAHNPEVMTAVDTIARLVGAMTIHLMRNGEKGTVREFSEISRIVDIQPNRNMTRSNFVRWIVRTMLLEGNGNAVVWPVTRRGQLRELVPIPPAFCAFVPTEIIGGYRIEIDGKPYDPQQLLHFVANPDTLYPWRGEGYRIQIAEVADNLKQAAATEKGFMSSKWKPAVIVKVDAISDEFRGPAGRRRLLDEYVKGSEAGEPWLIPADQFAVEQVKPLSLSDLALADFVKLDKETVAAILGVPPFVLGVGDFKREAWNNFINTTLMPLAQNIQQELTRKLIMTDDEYLVFNPRSLLSYDLSELVKAGVEMVRNAAMRRNELRDWAGLEYDEEMEELIVLENYIPINKVGEQKKLDGGET